jgi:hypothetical protein
MIEYANVITGQKQISRERYEGCCDRLLHLWVREKTWANSSYILQSDFLYCFLYTYNDRVYF